LIPRGTGNHMEQDRGHDGSSGGYQRESVTTMEKGRIIIVDDEKAILEILQEFLTTSGYAVTTFSDPKEALLALKANDFDVLITDLVMPRIDGLQVINFVQKEYLSTLAILMTGFGTLKTAIDAIRLGAFDYIIKPFELETMLTTVNSAMSYSSLLKKEVIPKGLTVKANLLRRFYENKSVLENVLESDTRTDRVRSENIIGNSLAMQRVFELIEKVADTSATVLITGKSGVGKELVAKAIHYASSRSNRPLVTMNCAAIPETLLESELFGFEKGAFTGAVNTRLGRFELSDGGSIFLDEIGDMSLNLQVKLLRVIQEKTFERIGGTKTLKVDIRIIAATNRELEVLVKEGKFREDLYYRLNVIPINIPPLKERSQDIPALISHFLERSNKVNNTAVSGITDEVLQVLGEYDYPGNVRELQNIIERMVVLKKTGYLSIEDIPEKLFAARREDNRPVDTEKGYDTLVSEYEKRLILEALEETHGVKSKAARILNINRTTLIEKMKRLGIQ
jgi:DNA-binding NtrC family response regulator